MILFRNNKLHKFYAVCTYVLMAAYLLNTSLLYGEVMTDGNLGAKLELTGKNFQITPELGQQLGGNLFHSFQSFNLNADESVTFSGSNSVQNIISRVTGGNPSRIDGLIRSTIPNADLYFINPYGVMFGENAKLDLQGGFHVSTADYLKLQGGGRFDARTPSNSLLTVAPVAAFGFLTNSPAAMTTQNSRLAVPNGKTLSLIGGELTLTGSEPPIYDETDNRFDLQSHSWLFAESGTLRLASLAASGEIANENIALSAQGGNIVINNTALITDQMEGGGSIFIGAGKIILIHSMLDATTVDRPGGILSINADELTLQDHSSIINGTHGKSQGGLMDIKVAGQLNVLDSEFDSSTYAIENGGQAGEIHLHAAQLNLSNSSISSESYNSGSAGLLDIKAQRLLLEKGAFISSSTHHLGQGGIVGLQVAENLTLRGRNQNGDSSGIFVSTDNKELENAGNAGYILIQAGQVNVEDTATINSDTIGAGRAGDLTVIAQHLNVIGGAQLGSGTFGSGQGGNAILQISGTLTVSGNRSDNLGISSGIFANSEDKSSEKGGNAGNIYIEAQNVQLLDGGNLNSATYGAGQGGTIEMHVADKLTVRGYSQQDNPSIISVSTTNTELSQAGNAGQMLIQAGQVNLENTAIINSNSSGTGHAGNLIITAQQLNITGGAQLGSGSFGSGHGGNIQLTVSDTLTVSGEDPRIGAPSGIFASSEDKNSEKGGNAGNINIEAMRVHLLNGGNISSATAGTGQGGNIQLATQLLDISGKTKQGRSSNIYASSFLDQLNAGNAGYLKIHADDIILSDGGRISTQSNHSGGGDIEIETAHLLHLYQGNIITSVKGGVGNGGNITVQRPEFTVLNQANVRAQADAGHGGNIYLAAQQFVYSTETVISASSQRGMDGEIWIDSPENSLHNQLATLPAAIPLEMGLKTPCSALGAENMSSLAVAMNHGIPNLPDDLQSSYLLEPFGKNRSQTQTVLSVRNAAIPTFKFDCRKTWL